MTEQSRPRMSILRRLSTPRFMFAMGAMELVLGTAYVAQPKLRGQGVVLLIMGAFMFLSGGLTRRREMRRARPAAAVPAARRVKAPPTVKRARGPKAGPKSRLAGPTRYKPEPLPEPRRVFRKKAGSP